MSQVVHPQPLPIALTSRPDRPLLRTISWISVPVVAASAGYAVVAYYVRQSPLGMRPFATAFWGNAPALLVLAAIIGAVGAAPRDPRRIFTLMEDPPPWDRAAIAVCCATTLLLASALLLAPWLLYGTGAATLPPLPRDTYGNMARGYVGASVVSAFIGAMLSILIARTGVWLLRRNGR